jgi:hypothetical protein
LFLQVYHTLHAPLLPGLQVPGDQTGGRVWDAVVHPTTLGMALANKAFWDMLIEVVSRLERPAPPGAWGLGRPHCAQPLRPPGWSACASGRRGTGTAKACAS